MGARLMVSLARIAREFFFALVAERQESGDGILRTGSK